tara:strand:+ start:636 stop:1574 length:939 start_codon:yes stop_codon:yes gene_type:complete
MPTIANAIEDTKRLLNSNTRTELDAVHTTLTSATETTIRLKYQTDGIRAGSYISISSGNTAPETLYVHKRNGEYITVQRAMDGSTAPSTLGSGSNESWQADSLIEVEPRFTGHQIYQALKNAIHALPENLYAVDTVTADFGTSVQSQSVTLSAGFNSILYATRTARDSEDRKIKFNCKMQEYDGAYTLIRQEGIEKAVTAYVTYSHPFVTGTLNLDTDLVSILKMSSEMTDIPPLGAGASLMLAEESTRLDLHAAGDSRGDGALNPGDRTRYSLILQAQYDRRVSQEARRLMAKYGIRTDGSVGATFPTTLR